MRPRIRGCLSVNSVHTPSLPYRFLNIVSLVYLIVRTPYIIQITPKTCQSTVYVSVELLVNSRLLVLGESKVNRWI